MNNQNLKYLLVLISEVVLVIAGVYFYFYEARQLFSYNTLNGIKLDHSFFIYYFRWLLLILLPIYSLSKLYNHYYGYLENSSPYIAFNLLYKTVYFLITVLCVFELFNKFYAKA